MNSHPVKYRAYIDGLRAIAVLAVLFFHAGIGCGGGYVGVDVFFVISGYLITGLILRDLHRGEFHILEFWERRVRRILPALTVVVLSCIATGWFLLLPQDFKELGQSVVAQAMLASNVFFWNQSGYFAQPAELQPLLHTWSLAVEEQFYLLFPFLLIALWRFSRKTVAPVVLAGCASFVLSVYLSYRHPSANFYLLPSRAWELLLGSFLAAISEQRVNPPRWLTESMSGGGLLAILCAVFFYNRETRFPGVAAILPCVGAALVIWANGRTLTFTGKLLAKRPIVFVGLISYSLYLWHWPVLAFSKYCSLDPISQSQRLLLLVASMVLAILSWKFVETPFRKRAVFNTRLQIFALAGISTAILLLAGLAIFRTQGMPTRLSAEAQRYANTNKSGRFWNNIGLKEALNGDFTELGSGDKHQPIDLLVWGDSHAMAAMPALDALCKEHSIHGVAAVHDATVPFCGYESRRPFSMMHDSVAFNDAIVEFIRKNRISNVLLVASWTGHINVDNGTARLRQGLETTINALKNSGTKIWIMKAVPMQHWNVPRALVMTVLHHGSTEELGLPLTEQLKESQRQDPIFEGLTAPDLVLLDPTDLFVSPSNLCRVVQNGNPLYFDAGHLTTDGAMVLRPLFEPIFDGIRKTSPPVANGG